MGENINLGKWLAVNIYSVTNGRKTSNRIHAFAL